MVFDVVPVHVIFQGIQGHFLFFKDLRQIFEILRQDRPVAPLQMVIKQKFLTICFQVSVLLVRFS